MAFINGLRSLSHHSTLGIPTSLSAKALTIAERAHYLLRKANEHATEMEWEEAELTASAGVEQLKMRFVSLSIFLLQRDANSMLVFLSYRNIFRTIRACWTG